MSLTWSRFQQLVGGASLIGVLVAVSTGAPVWLTVLFAGGVLYALALIFITNPTGRTVAVTAVAVATGIALTATLVHDHPSLARVESGQSAPTPSPTKQGQQSKPQLKVGGLKGGDAIPRCIRIGGTGTIPPGEQVWVGHTNDKDDSPNGNLMNLRQAKNITGKPGQWETVDDYWIGDTKDSRSFWIFVYELPDSAGNIIQQWWYPDGFSKEHKDWQATLNAPIGDVKPIASFKVTRTDNQGCAA
ncbi:hypothetical protein ACIBO9_49000 [Streptomyces prunicolor]|uniref:hypothetical protein n=1 Tax=Streptomyces prunicolor TaxID=67348 RepID=UPI0037CDC956